MFTVLNSYRNENELLYAVRDFASNEDLEVITEEELKLLVSMNLEIKDINDNIITLDGDTLNINVDDITDQINVDIEEQDEDEVDDFYSSYEDNEEELEEDESEVEEDEDSSDYDDFYSAYDMVEDEEPEGSVVSKLYENLTEEQIKVLKRYYLWYSQRLFNDAQKDPTLGLKNQRKIQAKKTALNQLRGDGEWRYAGFLDTGSLYAGYTCTLGHALRYMHLAWDITVGDIETCFFGEDYNVDFEDIIRSNNCIVYGIKCIGDFFEVDSECIKNLQKAQRESLRDMAIMYDFYMNNTVEEAKESFKFMDEVVKVISKKDIKGKALKKDYIPVLPFSVAAFYTQFREQDMIPPKSLVQTIRSCLVGWTDGEKYFSNKWAGELHYPNDSFIVKVLPTVLNLRGTDKDLLNNLSMRTVRYGYAHDFIDYILNYIYVAFTYEICGIYKFDAENNKDEGGRSKPVKAQLSMHYNNDTQNAFEDLDFSIDTCFTLLNLNSIISKFVNSYSSTEFPIDIVINDTSTDKVKFYLCQLNQSSLVYVINEFDKDTNSNLFDLLYFFTELNREFKFCSRKRRREFTSSIYSTSGTMFKLKEVYPIVLEKYSEFKSLYEKFINYVDIRNNKFIDDYNENEEKKRLERLERERERAERERVEREELEKREQEKLKEEENKKSEYSDIDTPIKLANFLSDNMSNYNLDSSWDLPKSIVNTVKKSGKEPSDRQLYHLKRLFKEVTGVDYDGVGSSTDSKIDLDDRNDLKDAINYILANDSLVSECLNYLNGTTSGEVKFKGVLNSILKYGKISSRQLVYAEAAKKVYDLKEGN